MGPSNSWLPGARSSSESKQLLVRQSGSETFVFDGLAELLTPGTEYILFLAPFTFDEAGPGTGEWIITGEVGAFKLENGQFRLTASVAPELGATLDPAVLTAAPREH